MHHNIPIVVRSNLSRTPHSHRRASIVGASVEDSSHSNSDVNAIEKKTKNKNSINTWNRISTHHGDEVLTPTLPTPTPTT
jgi:hypothetical protein